MVDGLPPRVKAAEDRARFREMIDASSLGDPEAKAAIKRGREYNEALPDRWASLRAQDLIDLLELYRDCRETGHDDHPTAVIHVLAEVDFEPSQGDLSDRRLRKALDEQ